MATRGVATGVATAGPPCWGRRGPLTPVGSPHVDGGADDAPPAPLPSHANGDGSWRRTATGGTTSPVTKRALPLATQSSDAPLFGNVARGFAPAPPPPSPNIAWSVGFCLGVDRFKGYGSTTEHENSIRHDIPLATPS